MNKVLRRVIALIPAVLIQLLWLYVLMRWLSPYAALINLLLSLFAVLPESYWSWVGKIPDWPRPSDT